MEKKIYTKAAADGIYKEVFGVKSQILPGQSALGSYRTMANEIKLNHNNDAEMFKKLNELIMPYYEDIKANPNKVI